MKKSLIAVAVILGSTTTFAQEKDYLPSADDWAIGVDATPFLNYAGNLIGGNDGNTAPAWNFLTTNQTITGKYFAADDMAYRGSLRLGFGSASSVMTVADRSSTAVIDYPNVAPTVENTMKAGNMNIGLSGGLEWRRGKGRLQGFYGGELGLNFSSSSETYTYGNALSVNTATVDVDVDAADDFGTGNLVANPGGGATLGQARVTERKSGMTTSIGIRGFIGAEYFVLPMISVGGEFGWGLGFTSNGSGSETSEGEGLDGGGANQIATISTTTDKSGSFGFDTDNVNSVFGPAGSLRMTFHF